eukprot:6173247-Pleurochrysis_carterae.AAC.4
MALTREDELGIRRLQEVRNLSWTPFDDAEELDGVVGIARKIKQKSLVLSPERSDRCSKILKNCRSSLESAIEVRYDVGIVGKVYFRIFDRALKPLKKAKMCSKARRMNFHVSRAATAKWVIQV